jgi:hypothetical protein
MTLRARMLLAMICVVLMGTAAPQKENSAVVGVWQAKRGELPFVTLTVIEVNQKLAGTMLFHVIKNNEAGTATSSVARSEHLLNTSFDGETLSFHVRSRRAESSMNFRLELAGSNEATLFQGGDEHGPGLKMIRDK